MQNYVIQLYYTIIIALNKDALEEIGLTQSVYISWC